LRAEKLTRSEWVENPLATFFDPPDRSVFFSAKACDTMIRVEAEAAFEKIVYR
jgi:hypothetical protein